MTTATRPSEGATTSKWTEDDALSSDGSSGSSKGGHGQDADDGSDMGAGTIVGITALVLLILVAGGVFIFVVASNVRGDRAVASPNNDVYMPPVFHLGADSNFVQNPAFANEDTGNTEA